MSTTSFKSALEDRLKSIAVQAVGVGSGLPTHVITFDDHLYSVDESLLPFWVGFALDKTKEADEIGAKYGDWIWHCQMYYLDTTTTATWGEGKDRRDLLVGAISDAFEGNHFLADSTGPLIDTDLKGVVESVWSVDVNTVSFDQSGQEGYYTFVSEIFIDVHTNKN